MPTRMSDMRQHKLSMPNMGRWGQCWKQISAHVDMWAPGSPEGWGEATVVLLGHNTDRTCRQPLPGAAAMRSSRKRCTGTAAGTKVAPVQVRLAQKARTGEPTRALGLVR